MAGKADTAPIFFERHEAEFSEHQTPAEKCVSGRPLQRTWNHYASADGKFFSGTWEAEPGCWKISYTEHEFCRILSGRSVLRDADGNRFELEAGDSFVIPAGFSGEWEVVETTRKLYAIYDA